MRFGPDVSNYQSQFSLADAQALVARHCSFIAIGRQAVNVTAQQQWDYAKQAGIEFVVEYLISLNGQWPVLFPETKYVAVDVEPNSEFITEQAIDDAIQWIRTQGKTPIIYSSNLAWESLGFKKTFPDHHVEEYLTKYGEQGIPLWDAHYDGFTNGYNLPVPFGGWTKCMIDQYTDHWNDGGLAYPLDMNDCEDDVFGPPPTPTPQPIDTAAIIADAEAIINMANRIKQAAGG